MLGIDLTQNIFIATKLLERKTMNSSGVLFACLNKMEGGGINSNYYLNVFDWFVYKYFVLLDDISVLVFTTTFSIVFSLQFAFFTGQ